LLFEINKKFYPLPPAVCFLADRDRRFDDIQPAAEKYENNDFIGAPA